MIERIVVLGAGAVGGSLGGLLAAAGRPVVFVARGAHGRILRDRGLVLRLPDRTLELCIPCVERVDQVEWRAGDLVLLATKLQDAERALDDLLEAAGSELPVACAVNGVHGEQWAAERFRRVLSVLVWVGATHLEAGEVRIYSPEPRGVLDTGPVQGDTERELSEEFCAHLRSAGFEAVSRGDIARWKNAKWILNLGGAAQAMVSDDWKRVAAEARSEGERVFEALGVDYVPLTEFMERVSSVTMEEIDGRSRAGGSTWQSFQRGQPLESPWLEGALADLAEQHGLSAPVNRALAKLALVPRSVVATEVMESTEED